jgi:hypothetical protein
VRIDPKQPPRRFQAGAVAISHCADVALDADEQVTFVAPSGTELDVVRKSWGYYATPSLNGRLAAHDLRAALVAGPDEPPKLYLLLVERGREPEFETYCEGEAMRVVAWLDSDQAVADAVRRLSQPT